MGVARGKVRSALAFLVEGLPAVLGTGASVPLALQPPRMLLANEIGIRTWSIDVFCD